MSIDFTRERFFYDCEPQQHLAKRGGTLAPLPLVGVGVVFADTPHNLFNSLRTCHAGSAVSVVSDGK